MDKLLKGAARREVVLPLVVLGMLAILATGIVPASLAASPQVIVRPDPLSLGMRSGDRGSISIRVDNAQNLYGLEFHLSFDPNIVEVVDADSSKPGVQLEAGGWLKGGFAAVNKADNAKGTIDYAVTLLNPAPPINGGGIVATISFKAKKDGTSPLKIVKAILATREAQEINSQWQNGAIGVSILGQAPQVQVTTGNGNEQPSGGAVPPSSSLPTSNILLIGAAGVGVLGFFGALVLVAAILVFRRRR